MKGRVVGLSLAVLIAIVVLVGCGGDDATTTTAPSGTDTTAASSSGDATTSTQAVQEETKFTVSFTSLGLSSVPLLAAIDTLRSQGYEIDTPEIPEAELAVEGLGRNEFQFSSGSTSPMLIAVQKGGAPIKIIADRVANEWTVYSTTDIATPTDLDGKRLAIHSEGAVSTAMLKDWLNHVAPDISPNFIVISGSSNRYAALVAGQIDASPLELVDGITLDAEAGDRFHQLASFSKDLPDLKPTTIYGNTDFMEANPATTAALLKALLEEHRKINSTPGYLKQLVEKYLPSAVKPELMDQVTQTYADRGLFESDGGVTEGNIDYTIKFFEGAGSIEPGLTVDDVADLSYLQTALDELK